MEVDELIKYIKEYLGNNIKVTIETNLSKEKLDFLSRYFKKQDVIVE